MTASRTSSALSKRLHRIKAFLFDVEGVLTDGGLSFLQHGTDSKAFHPDDIDAIRDAVARGVRIGIITGGMSAALTDTLRSLSVTDIYQDALDKLEPYEDFRSMHGLRDEDIAYMGDSMLDLSVLKRVGFAAAPPNAHPSVRIAVHYISKQHGGHGAAKEVLDLLFSAKESV